MPRKKNSVKRLKRKLKEIEESLSRFRESDEDSDRPTWSRCRSRSPLHRRNQTPPLSPVATHRSQSAGSENVNPDIDPFSLAEDKPTLEASIVDLTEKQGEDEISADILALLGEAPQEVKYGPDILPHLCSRWKEIIKKGLDKEIKAQLIKKYPPPDNCKIIDAPKLNPEAQAAAGENVVKRDKAIEIKQMKVSCAIAALGLALGKLCKQPSTNSEIITLVSDAARLLCDYQFCESSTRKHFIVTGLDSKTAREAVKDTEVDEWLFGENFAEKLKASKAIEKTGKELTSQTSKTKKPHSHLNFKGPTSNSTRMKTQPQRSGYQHYQKRQLPQVNAAKPNYQQKPRYCKLLGV